jgi:ketosteroid isomerase-like protein
MRKLLILILCVFAFCINSCRRTSHPPAQTENEKHTADVNAILRLKMTKMVAWSDKNAGIVPDLYEDDAFVLENGKSLHGIDEIKTEIMAKDTVADAAKYSSGTGRTESVDVAKSGDIGYSHDIGEIYCMDPKTNRVKTEKIDYVTVYRKQTNRSWKIVIDVWTSDKPAWPMTDKLLHVFKGVR